MTERCNSRVRDSLRTNHLTPTARTNQWQYRSGRCRDRLMAQYLPLIFEQTLIKRRSCQVMPVCRTWSGKENDRYNGDHTFISRHAMGVTTHIPSNACGSGHVSLVRAINVESPWPDFFGTLTPAICLDTGRKKPDAQRNLFYY